MDAFGDRLVHADALVHKYSDHEIKYAWDLTGRQSNTADFVLDARRRPRGPSAGAAGRPTSTSRIRRSTRSRWWSTSRLHSPRACAVAWGHTILQSSASLCPTERRGSRSAPRSSSIPPSMCPRWVTVCNLPGCRLHREVLPQRTGSGLDTLSLATLGARWRRFLIEFSPSLSIMAPFNPVRVPQVDRIEP